MAQTSRRRSDYALRIIITGLVAQFPLGGVSWDYLQYVLGLRRLGHEVFYFEDTGQWPFDPVEGGTAPDCRANVRFLEALMRHLGLEEHWAYRVPAGPTWYGLPDAKREEVMASADLLVNVSGTVERPEDYDDGRLLL